jgi:hypothetical protein
MKTFFAAVFVAALIVSDTAVCFFPDAQEVAEAGSVEVPDAPADGAPSADASTENAAPDSDQPAGQTLEDTKDKKPPMNVMRHRPGACPEGPPCKEGD